MLRDSPEAMANVIGVGLKYNGVDGALLAKMLFYPIFFTNRLSRVYEITQRSTTPSLSALAVLFRWVYRS